MYNNAPVMNTAPMMTPVMNSGPMVREPLGTHNPIHNPTDLYAHQKGKVVVKDDKIKTVEKMTYVDPVTGMEENAKIKTKIVGDRSRSRSRSQGKSKTAYDHKVEDTINGPRTVIKEKHREGGLIDNLKNKFHNMTHRKWLLNLLLISLNYIRVYQSNLSNKVTQIQVFGWNKEKFNKNGKIISCAGLFDWLRF